MHFLDDAGDGTDQRALLREQLRRNAIVMQEPADEEPWCFRLLRGLREDGAYTLGQAPTRGLGEGGGGLDALLAKARDIAGVKVLGVRTEVTDRAALRELAEQLRDKLGQSVVLVGSVADGKAQLVLTVAKDLTSRLKAGDLIKNSAQIVGGSGGGRPDMAQAGGTELARLDEAIDAIYASVG